ncbi:HAMP domain-containing sensor histidine kinase [Ruminococcus sp. Marseille-P6503]|uniref:sensor histidine kinase n=1 Tax=Ruminococcus sp. Marseille-P6503 TaxID=2364796 RepID=UPI000F549C3B|nr:HAMP domain-containing sensor histidine kinase [Ruminococcus sp. Marseille-P6503]
MIKKLRRKFVLIAVFSLFLVEVVIIGTINIINVCQQNAKSDELLAMITQNDGKLPDFGKSAPDKPPEDIRDQSAGFDGKGINPETKYITRYFTVRADERGQITSIDTSHIAAVTSDDAAEYANEALRGSSEKGWSGNYRYAVSQSSEGSLLVFVDCRSQLETRYQFLAISLAIGFAGLAVVSVLIAVFSKRAIRPVIESMEKQKQFITDAGHEIKTPLAIISANTEVLELTAGGSEWTASIKNQTKRLSELIKNLLTLSKMDEEIKTVFEKFNISDAVYDAASPFSTLAASRGKSLSTDIQNGIEFTGDEGMIRQLVSILLDNAVKYADDGGEIRLCLKAEHRQLELSVHNPCSVKPEGELSRLFDRFYRADSSRSRETGGYGIGLSIAKAICDSHKCRITAKYESGGMTFRVTAQAK